MISDESKGVESCIWWVKIMLQLILSIILSSHLKSSTSFKSRNYTCSVFDIGQLLKIQTKQKMTIANLNWVYLLLSLCFKVYSSPTSPVMSRAKPGPCFILLLLTRVAPALLHKRLISTSLFLKKQLKTPLWISHCSQGIIPTTWTTLGPKTTVISADLTQY